MPQITAINPTKRKADRFAVRVDGRTVATLSGRSVAALRLAVDQNWDPDLAEQVDRAQAFDKAYDAALSRLNRRAMSRRQLHDKLRQLDHSQSVVDQVLDRLEELRLLDDEELGRELIRQTIASRPAGPRLLRSKLQQRGFPAALIDRLLETELPSTADSVRGAAALAQQKLRTMSRLDPLARKRRLWGMLARRGFDADTIEAALRDLTGLEEDW